MSILLAASGSSAASGEDFGIEWVGDTFFSDTTLSPSTSTASFTMQTDGSVTGNDGQTADWRLPNLTDIGDDYDVMFTLDSGSTPTTGTLNTWLSLSSPRGITNTQPGIGVRTSTIRVQIRNANSLVVREDVNVTVRAEVDA